MSDDNTTIEFDLKDYLQGMEKRLLADGKQRFQGMEKRLLADGKQRLQGMEKRLLADSKQRHEAHEKVTAVHFDSIHKRIDDLRSENARNLTIFGIAVVIILTIFTAVVLPTVHSHNVTDGRVATEDAK